MTKFKEPTSRKNRRNNRRELTSNLHIKRGQIVKSKVDISVVTIDSCFQLYLYSEVFAHSVHYRGSCPNLEVST